MALFDKQVDLNVNKDTIQSAWNSLEDDFKKQYYNNDYNAFASAVKTQELNMIGYGKMQEITPSPQDTIPSLSDEDYNQIIGSIQRGEPIDWLDAGFASMIGEKAYTSGDTATFKLLKGEFPSLKTPVSSPEEIVSGYIQGSKKGSPIATELPVHLTPLTEYSGEHVRNVAEFAGVGPAEYLADKFDSILPMLSSGITGSKEFTDDYILNKDWGKEALNHLEISPNAEYYEKYKDKQLVLTEEYAKRIEMHDGQIMDTGSWSGVGGFKRKEGDVYRKPPEEIQFRIKNTGKIISVKAEDIVINQQKFFRTFAGLGVPRKEGEIKQNKRQFYKQLAPGEKAPHIKRFIARRAEDGSLHWFPFKQDDKVAKPVQPFISSP